MRKRSINRILTTLATSAMLAANISMPAHVLAAPEENTGEKENDTEEELFVPGYLPAANDTEVPAVCSGVSYQEIRQSQVSDGMPLLMTAPTGATESAYPASYDGNWLTKLKDTFPATRNQNPYGSCWAHTGAFLGEAYLNKHGMAGTSIDLSELHLAYWTYYTGTPSAAAGDTGDTVSFAPTASASVFLNNGGNLEYAAQTLMRQRGFAKESVAPYSTASTVTSGTAPDANTERQDDFYLTNAYKININSNPELVKSAIKENGAVGVSFCAQNTRNPFGEDFYNDEHNAYYCPINYMGNHAVALVGWDDNFPKTFFNDTPQNDGAWLVRNSWSTTAEADYMSYFWLSYEDESLKLDEAAWAYEVQADFPYDNHYYYDSQIHDSVFFTTNATSLYYANVFTVNGEDEAEKEVLKAIDMEVPSLDGNGSEYTVEIYRDLTGNTPNTGTKVSTATTTGTLYFPGFYTIELSDDVELTRGSKFAVVVSFNGQSGQIAEEADIVGFNGVNASTGTAGNSYYSYGYGWENNEADFCIGALTTDVATSSPEDSGTVAPVDVTGVSLNKSKLELKKDETATLTATVKPAEATNKEVSWKSDKEDVAVVDDEGKITAVSAGTATITVTTKDGSFTATCEVTVKASDSDGTSGDGTDDGDGDGDSDEDGEDDGTNDPDGESDGDGDGDSDDDGEDDGTDDPDGESDGDGDSDSDDDADDDSAKDPEDEPADDSTENTDYRNNSFDIEKAVEGVHVIDADHTLKLIVDENGNFKDAMILDEDGDVDTSVNSYVCNIFTGKTNEDGTEQFYSLVFRNGKWDTTYDSATMGAYAYKGESYMVAGGVINQNANGLQYTGDAAGWKFLAAGKVVRNRAGLVMYQDKWFWIDDTGSCDQEYAAIVNWSGADFLVHGGMLRTDFTGFTYDPQNRSVWYHIENGQVWGDGEITDASIEGDTITRTVVNGVVQ